MKTIIQTHKEGKYFVAEDLVTDIADQGISEKEAIANLKKGLEEHYQLRMELASVSEAHKVSFLDLGIEKYVNFAAPAC